MNVDYQENEVMPLLHGTLRFYMDDYQEWWCSDLV